MNAISQWWQDATFYHIYPLGLCGAPLQNDFKTVNRLEALYPWLDQMQALGMDSLYLGPIFQSTSHGYDTMDYYRIDSRLGTNEDFARFAAELHRRGMKLVLDGVFNHTSSDSLYFDKYSRYTTLGAYESESSPYYS